MSTSLSTQLNVENVIGPVEDTSSIIIKITLQNLKINGALLDIVKTLHL